MRIISYQKRYESEESQRKAGRYNPAYVISYRTKHGRRSRIIGAGSQDHLDVVKEGDETFVVTRNYGLNYVGLEVFDDRFPGPDGKVGDVFAQNDWEVEEYLGKRGLDLTAHTIARRLSEYVSRD
jgi:hypothetical protein